MKDKIELWNGFAKEDRILISSILDKYRRYKRTGLPQSSHFLNPYEEKLVTRVLEEKKIPYDLVRCHALCENGVIVFGDQESPITVYWVETDGTVEHRDVLGTLFSIGMEKGTIGDILVEKTGFYLTNLTKMNSFLEENLYQIKKQLVTLKKVPKIELTESHFQEIDLIVSSMRLDQIVSRLSNQSRSMTKKVLQEKKVIVNYREIEDLSYLLKEGDILSIRGVGKFKIQGKKSDTKKQKEIIEVWKYQ